MADRGDTYRSVAPTSPKVRSSLWHRITHVLGTNPCEPHFATFREPIAGLEYDVLDGYRCVECGLITPRHGKLTPRATMGTGPR